MLRKKSVKIYFYKLFIELGNFINLILTPQLIILLGYIASFTFWG